MPLIVFQEDEQYFTCGYMEGKERNRVSMAAAAAAAVVPVCLPSLSLAYISSSSPEVTAVCAIDDGYSN